MRHPSWTCGPAGRAVVRPAALALLAALALPAAGGAQTAADRTESDTSRAPAAFSFRKSPSLETEYLARALAPRTDIPIEIDLPSAERARSYAKRYRISQELAQSIVDVATAEGVDPELAFRLVRTESRFKTRARGPRGALGLVQLMPSTARGLDRSLRTESQIMEPVANLRTGFRYLRHLIERYDGNVRLGLLAYNRGEGTVDRVLRSGRDPENGYSHKVLGTRGSNPYRGSGLLKRPAD